MRKWAPKLIHRLESLPVIPFTNFCQRILMLVYCVCEEHRKISDLYFFSEEEAEEKAPPTSDDPSPLDAPDRRRVYQAESQLLRMVREGDLDYMDQLTKIGSVFRGKQKLSNDSLQHARLSQVVIISLLTRSAIEGGLSPEISYPLQDATISSIDRADSIPEITEIGLSLIDQLVRLVHQAKQKPDVSHPVQLCCDYIETHLGEELSISTLASHIGYADYYLSRKFKAETGMSVHDYIKSTRVSRAKTLLATTDLSIAQIAEMLGFGSRNFFSDVFRAQTGLPPAKWREQNRLI